MKEAFAIAGEERACGFFEVFLVAQHGGEELVGGGLSRLAHFGGVALGLLHQAAKRGRGAAGLGAEPFPMARQQGDFAGLDAEFGAAGPLGRILLEKDGDVGSEVQFDRVACFDVEGEDLGGWVSGLVGFGFVCHEGEFALGDQVLRGENGNWHGFTRMIQLYPGKNNVQASE